MMCLKLKFRFMKYKTHNALIILFMICLIPNLFSHSKEWKTKNIDGGKIMVKYCISERIDEKGKKVPLIEDIVKSTDSLNILDCIALMKDVSRHKEFTGDYISEKVGIISDNEYIVYYFSKNPWPIANSDCVANMKFSEDKVEKTAVFRFTAAPSEYKTGNVKRMTYYDITYSFKDLGNGTVEITETGKTTPPVDVPLWIIKSAFPGAPASSMRKLVKLSKEKNK